MKPEEQIKALAELDGWTCNSANGFCTTGDGGRLMTFLCRRSDGVWTGLPDYLTSYDDIIPLIQKHPKDTIHKCLNCLYYQEDGFNLDWSVLATPSQLCEALLRTTGKWIL